MTQRPDCTACRHRVATDTRALSECRHPGATLVRSMAFMASAHGAPEGAALAEIEAVDGPGGPAIKVAFQLEPVLQEKATWPLIFDPQWIVECSGFEPVPALESAE